MKTIQIDDQVFGVLQRAAGLLAEPSPNAALRRILLSDPVLSALPPATDAFDAPPPSTTTVETTSREATPESATRDPIALGAIPPPRSERPGRLPTWRSLDELAAPPRRSVAAQAARLPPGLRQAFDVIHLVVRHRVPRPEAIRRVSDLRRASGAPSHGPRLTLGADEFDRMLRQPRRAALRERLKATFPGYDDAVDAFFDELSPRSRTPTAV